MSWDIFIFNSTQKIENVENIDDQYFVPINFTEILEKHFDNIKVDENHRRISGKNFSIEYFISAKTEGNLMFSLYGENALFELIRVSKIHNWQIFDTGNGEMIDLENPTKNGYENFEKYLKEIINKY
jgi:hypothetical protein